MSWPTWPTTGVAPPTVVQGPVINSAPNVVNPAAAQQYSPEQWAQMQQHNWQQWAQWQQQFQQWQQQYGAEYQKSLTAMQQPSRTPVQQPTVPYYNIANTTQPPLPLETKPPPPPDDSHGGIAQQLQLPSQSMAQQVQPSQQPPLPQSAPVAMPNVSALYGTTSQYAQPPPTLPSNYNTLPPPIQAAPPKEQYQYTQNQHHSAPPPIQGGYQSRNVAENNQQFNKPSNFSQNNSNWQQPGNRNQQGYTDNRANQQTSNVPYNKGDYGVKRPYNQQTNERTDMKRNRFENQPETNKWQGNNQRQQGWNDQPTNQPANQQWKSDGGNQPRNQGWGETRPQPLLQLKPIPPLMKPNIDEPSEAEKKFDKQFGEWEAQFQKWKEQNAHHPDTTQYKEYEKKWVTWRAQLLERREQMRRKRLGITGNSPKLPPDMSANVPQDTSAQPSMEQVQQPLFPQQQKESNMPSSVQESPQQAPLQIGPQVMPPSMRNDNVQILHENVTSDLKDVHTISKPPNATTLATVKSSPPLALDNLDPETEATLQSEGNSTGFLNATSGDGIPGLDLVKEGENQTENTTEEQKPTPDLEALSRGIDSILGDQNLMNMLSMVSKKTQPSQSITNTNIINISAPATIESPKFSPEEQSVDNDEYSNQGNFDNQLQSNYIVGAISENSTGLNEAENIPFNSGNTNVGSGSIDPGNLGPFVKGFNAFSSNTENFGRGPNDFNRGPNDSNRGPGNFGQEPGNQIRAIGNFNHGAADVLTGLGDMICAPGNIGRGPGDFTRGPPGNRGPGDLRHGHGDLSQLLDFNRGISNIKQGPDGLSQHPDFNRVPGDLNRGPGSLARPADLNRGLGDLNRGPGELNSLLDLPHGSGDLAPGPNDFNRGLGNFKAGNNFGRNPDNFNRGPDNFNRGPDNFNRGLDNFNRGNFNRNQDTYNQFDNFNRYPDNFKQGPDNLSRGPDTFNRGADNFGGKPGHVTKALPSLLDLDFSKGPGTFNKGFGNLAKASDSFSGAPDNLNRSIDYARDWESDTSRRSSEDFSRENLTETSDSVKSGPAGQNIRAGGNFDMGGFDSFNKRAVDNFSRGGPDFRRAPPFDRGENNFQRGGADTFRGGPDKCGRGDDGFNRGGSDNFNRSDSINRGPDTFQRDRFNRGSDRFNQGPDYNEEENFNRPASEFDRGPENFDKGPKLGRGPSRFDIVPSKNFNLPLSENFGRESTMIKKNTATDGTSHIQPLIPLEHLTDAWNKPIKSLMQLEHLAEPWNKPLLPTKEPVLVPPEPVNAEENIWKPASVIDYDHKPLKAAEPDILLVPINMFDYRHKLLSRIPYPQRPKWLLDAVKNLSGFDIPIGRQFESSPLKRDRERMPFDDRDRKSFDDRDRKTYDRDRKPFDNRDRKSFEDRDRKAYDDRDRERRYDERDKKFSDSRGKSFEERDRKYIDDRDRKLYGEKDRNDRDRKFNDDRDRKFNDDRDRKFNDDRDRKFNDDRDRKFNDDHDRKFNDDRDRKFNDDRDRKFNDDRDRKFNDKDRKRSDEKDQKQHGKRDQKEPEDSKPSGEEQFENTSKNKEDSVEVKNNIDNIFDNQNVNKPKKSNVTLVDELLSPPGRFSRPPRIVIILRGPPGSGKSHLAKLIKDKEVENGGSAPRIICLDDYFMVEQDKEVDEDGKKVKVKEMVYEYEECMEGSYRQSLMKAFKKTITDGYFSFVVIDNVNDKVKYFGEMWSFAKQNGFQVYICEMDLDVQACTKRNIHGRSEIEIERCVAGWEPTPTHHPILDACSLLETESIMEVEMEEIDSPSSVQAIEEEHIASKWDTFDYSLDNLAKLDGISKPLRPSRTMEDYLHLDEWAEPVQTKPGQKRVRWADLEEHKKQEKMRAIGFVVGHTNWDRMMDPTMGGSALTQTKYIERYK